MKSFKEFNDIKDISESNIKINPADYEEAFGDFFIGLDNEIFTNRKIDIDAFEKKLINKVKAFCKEIREGESND